MEYFETLDPDEPIIAKHSGFGIASFVIVLGAGLLVFSLFAIAGVLEVTTPGGIDEESPVTVVVGLALIACLLVDLLGIALGVVGLCQPRQRKPFAVLGVVFGSLILLGAILLMIIGALME